MILIWVYYSIIEAYSMEMTIKYLRDIWFEEKHAHMNQFHHYKKTAMSLQYIIKNVITKRHMVEM